MQQYILLLCLNAFEGIFFFKLMVWLFIRYVHQFAVIFLSVKVIKHVLMEFNSYDCFSPVPKDREKFYFKLKQGVEKKVVITVRQISNKELAIER